MNKKKHRSIKKSNDSPAEQQKKIKSLQVSQYKFSGPLPHPALLNAYNEIVSNGGERIFKMAEKEQAHNHRIIEKEQIRKNRAQIFGFIIIIVSIIGGIILVGLDKNILGFGVFFSGLTAVVLAYIYGKKYFFNNKKKNNK
ncbi:MAG: DUF2335 domain-containing protein [bacterium]